MKEPQIIWTSTLYVRNGFAIIPVIQRNLSLKQVQELSKKDTVKEYPRKKWRLYWENKLSLILILDNLLSASSNPGKIETLGKDVKHH
jgi:hypothetical protein